MDLKIGGQVGYWLLRKALGSPKRPQQGRKGPDQGAPDRDKLDQFFGPAFIPSLAGKTVLDYGCGHGRQAVDVALGGPGMFTVSTSGMDVLPQLACSRLERA